METLAKWSIADYHRMISAGILDDRRVELIDGDIIEMSPEGPKHCYLTEQFVTYLRQILKGQVWVREAHPITLSSSSEPEPDIAIVKLPRTNYLDRHPYPEDIYWLIEISDRTLAKAKIPEYWVVNVKAKKVIVFSKPTEADYLQKNEYTSRSIAPLAFQDRSIELSKIFDY